MYCNFVISTSILTLHIKHISLIRIEKTSLSLLRKNNKVKPLYLGTKTFRILLNF